ncbi:MAG: NUDIX hydrolase [Gammaproteobacteria bacterium]
MRRYLAAEIMHRPGERPDGSTPEQSPWRRDARRERFRNPWFTVHEDRAWNARAGRHFDYGVVSFSNRAVGVLALEPDGRVWLVGQHRYPLEEFSWELPMGGVPAAECLLDGAQRELKEETGLAARHWEVLLERVHLSNSVTDEVGTVFLATGLEPGAMAEEDNEELWVIRMPLDDAVSAVLDGRITDSLTVAGLLAMALRRREGEAGPGPGTPR